MKKEKKTGFEFNSEEVRFSLIIFTLFLLFIIIYIANHSINEAIILLPVLLILLSILLHTNCYKKCEKLTKKETGVGVILLVLYIFIFYFVSDIIVQNFITFGYKQTIIFFGYSLNYYNFLSLIYNLLLSFGILLSTIYTTIIIPCYRKRKKKVDMS